MSEDTESLTSSPLTPDRAGSRLPALNAISSATDTWGRILSRFPHLTSPIFASKPHHDVQYRIVIDGPPVMSRTRRLSPTNLSIAKKAFHEMLSLGIVRRSSSQFRSTLVLVDKPDGSKSICGDYTQLNKITLPDSYPFPHLHDFSTHLAGCHLFSKIDLLKGHHQITMALQDIEKTSVATPVWRIRIRSDSVRSFAMQLKCSSEPWTPPCRTWTSSSST